MDPQTYDRWLEVSFYYFCSDILKKTGNLLDIMDLVEALAPIGKYDIIQVKQLVQEVIASYRIRPTREELALLCYKNKIKVRNTKRYLAMGNKKLYQIVAADKEDPREFYPRLNSKQHQIIRQFMKTIDYIREAGL